MRVGYTGLITLYSDDGGLTMAEYDEEGKFAIVPCRMTKIAPPKLKFERRVNSQTTI